MSRKIWEKPKVYSLDVYNTQSDYEVVESIVHMNIEVVGNCNIEDENKIPPIS